MDEDKLTFIILAREGDNYIPDTVEPTDPRISSLSMVGDVNIFFSGSPMSVLDSRTKPASDDDQEFTAEAEVMIAGIVHNCTGFLSSEQKITQKFRTAEGAMPRRPYASCSNIQRVVLQAISLRILKWKRR